MEYLNLYAGVGGQRRKLKNINVTAVEHNPEIAAVYKKLYPQDCVVVGDAHEYLLRNYERFDFVWSSPPCPTHSRMRIATRHKTEKTVGYFDASLYQEIIFLKTFFKGKWCVENVVPYYEPLIPAHKIDRHLFWSNFHIPDFTVKKPGSLIYMTVEQLMDWLDIHFTEKLYCDGNHDLGQVLRSCVHPELGLHILNNAFKGEKFGRSAMPSQALLFD